MAKQSAQETENNVNDKVDEIKNKISDLDTIRSNAEKGATALQEEDLKFVTDGDIDNIFK